MINLFFYEKIGRRILSWIQHYNHDKYWYRRSIVTNPSDKTNILIKLYYLYYIKNTDAYHNCSFGTNLNSGSYFSTPPRLPHGPNGIIIGHDLKIGCNCTIFQQVTLAHGGGRIGDNVLLGAGAKVLAGVSIGDNVKVGANCVVVENIPDNATVVLPKPRILLHN
ncbi:DapH/DapD/GlmU-related protein [uncultured Parabacteroides sp.]|uniref:DapH/DapD/GlmU-related protein n=1 Tax=uncultured Parabacteroides sp. TaxID=512312 RepID=UPI0025954182|nr:DapH/DapD/GlmU-related protein [uncultured Parabacteroides sp.]